MRTWLYERLRFRRKVVDCANLDCAASLDLEALVRAHGDWLAFIATILERERVIAADELARSLSEFASLTAADRPKEGRILAFWAAYLQDTSIALRDVPSLH